MSNDALGILFSGVVIIIGEPVMFQPYPELGGTFRELRILCKQACHAHFAGATLQGNSQTIGIDQENARGAIDYIEEPVFDMTRGIGKKFLLTEYFLKIGETSRSPPLAGRFVKIGKYKKGEVILDISFQN